MEDVPPNPQAHADFEEDFRPAKSDVITASMAPRKSNSPVPEPREKDKSPYFFSPYIASSVPVCMIVLGGLFAQNVPLLIFGTGESRSNLYQTLASAFAALLGFEIAAGTIFLSIPHEKFSHEFAKQKSLRNLFQTYMNAIWASAGMLVVSVIGLALDKFDCVAWQFFIEFIVIVGFFGTLAYLLQTIDVMQTIGRHMLKKIELTAKSQPDDK